MAAEQKRISRFWRSLEVFVESEAIHAVREHMQKEHVTDMLHRQCIRCEHEGENAKEHLVSIFEGIVKDLHPLSIKEGSLDCADYLKEAPVLLNLCRVLLTAICHSENTENKEIVSWRTSLLKRLTVQLVVVCACHMRPNSWTSGQTRSQAQALLAAVCESCHCDTVEQLLTGTAGHDTGYQPVFLTGIMGHVLDTMRPFLTIDDWHTCPTIRYAMVWCVMQIKYPFVGEFIPKLLPPLLLLLDDHEVENEIIGVSCLHHVIINMNAAELLWYGRANVIFEALHRLLYTNVPELVTAIHPCILSILKVLEPSPWKLNRKGTEIPKRHAVFQVILTTMEYESKVPMRNAYSTHLADFVDYLGITLLKHFKKFLSVVFAYLEVYDRKDEGTRLNILLALKTAMIHTWTRLPSHCDAILKALLKLIIDVSLTDDASEIQAQKTLLNSCVDCLILLRRCCGQGVEEALQRLESFDCAKVAECARAARQDREFCT